METSGKDAHDLSGDRDAFTSTASFAGRTVSRVGYGAAQLDRLRDRRDEAVALLRRAVGLGVNHVDTAEFYGFGFVNDVIREALRPEDDVLVVTKVGADPNPGGRLPLRLAQRPEQLRASVEDNLRSLGVDRLPVVNLRRLDSGPGLRPDGDQVVDLDDQLAVMTALREEGKIGAIGLSSVTLDGLRRALPAGIVCVQNAYSLVSRGDEDMLELCVAEDIAWVPFFPLGGAFPGLPKVTDEPAVHAVAESLGVTPSAVGLAWLLRHAPNVLLVPGTADAVHLEANMAVDEITFDDATRATLDAVESRSNEVPIG
ncbi:aldo/keto reductase [Amycolatopsis sp. H20-H5]|uniref:aldo/keto reductase n=1 Tax=Amycolatopsis sp. H20-H5 TaxID=3046309 RepID=UPI002DBC9312|nr:aldo/keto reductase [Amycolatopsis sp. H20-H5]MEC3980599.1 aldo/keto reductase [Amycolatopsis sp. H20-H5]